MTGPLVPVLILGGALAVTGTLLYLHHRLWYKGRDEEEAAETSAGAAAAPAAGHGYRSSSTDNGAACQAGRGRLCGQRAGRGPVGWSAGELGEAGEVFAEDVELEVDAGAGDDAAEVGVLEGVGDDGDAEAVALRVADGERDAVDRH